MLGRHFKKFRKRWMVLSNHQLYSFKQEKEYQNPTEVIDLYEYDQCTASSENNSSTAFEIISEEGDSEFHFQASSENERKDWVKHINKIIRLKPHKLRKSSSLPKSETKTKPKVRPLSSKNKRKSLIHKPQTSNVDTNNNNSNNNNSNKNKKNSDKFNNAMNKRPKSAKLGAKPDLSNSHSNPSKPNNKDKDSKNKTKKKVKQKREKKNVHAGLANINIDWMIEMIEMIEMDEMGEQMINDK